MPTEIKVHPKDEKPVQGAEGEAIQPDADNVLPFEVKGEADLQRLFEENPKIRDEFDWDGDPDAIKKFLAKYGDPAAKPAEDTPANRETEEDFLAPDKPVEKKPDVQPKPETAAQPPASDPKLQAQFDEIKGQLTAVLKEVEEVKKGAPVKAKEQISAEIKEIDLSNLTDLPEDVDLFTEDGQNQAKQRIKALTQALRQVTDVAKAFKQKFSEIDGLKGEVSTVKTEMAGVKDQVKEREGESAGEKQAEAEFKTIDEMVKAHKDIFGEKVRPIREIEDEYVDSIQEMLAKVAKSEAKALDENGRFTPEAKRVLELARGATDKAKRFQARCKEMEVGLPEDVGILDTVYEIRQIQRELSHKDSTGKTIKSTPYKLAVENYLGRNKDKFVAKERLESRNAHERAVENRKRFAPTSRPSAPAEEPDEVTNLPPEEMQRILETEPKKLTKQERQTRFKALLYVGTPVVDARYAAGLDDETLE